MKAPPYCLYTTHVINHATQYKTKRVIYTLTGIRMASDSMSTIVSPTGTSQSTICSTSFTRTKMLENVCGLQCTSYKSGSKI